MSYSEEFPVGTRVVISAGPGEGSDQEWNGHAGKIIAWHGSFAEIKPDRGKKFWPKGSVLIDGYNIRKATS
jgi:hypothetical protein